MADIAAIFHWSEDAMSALPLDRLLMWQDLAIERFKAMQPQG